MAISPNEAAELLLECVCNALSDDDRAVCRCYQTVGTPVIASCCECNDDDFAGVGELSIHFVRLFDADPSTLVEVQRVRPCKGGVTAASFRMVLVRCFPTINERGELPDQADLEEAAADQHRDVELLWQSLTCCSELDLRVDDISIDLNPASGCSNVYADITVAVRIPAPSASPSL